MKPDLVEVCLTNMAFERIVETDVLAMIENPHLDIIKDGRVVDLACGHKLLTRAMNRARCPRCREMLRRSLLDGSEDYDSFRKGLVPDRMEWEGDTMRIFHEPAYHLELLKKQDIERRDRGEIDQTELSKRLIRLERNGP